MKNLKMLYIALIALVTGAFGACTNEFEPGPQASGPQVSFADTNVTSVEFTGAEGEGTQKLVLNRAESTEALMVDIIAEVEKGAENLFSIPEIAVFEAGETTTELVFTVDTEKLENDKTYKVKFYLLEEVSTPYGCNEWTVSFALNPWELVKDSKGNNAKGKFRGNDLISSLLNIDTSVEIDVNIYEHKSRKGYYKVEDPWALSAALGFGYSSVAEAEADGLGVTHAHFLIDASNPNQVVFAQQAVGIDIGYGDMIIESGYPRYITDPAAGAGTLAEGIITFPTRGCIYAMPGYKDSAYYGNVNGMFRIVLPGVEIADYSLAVAYDGMDVAADNKTTTAKFKFTYGADVTGINYMIVAGNQEEQASALLSTLVAGTDENILSVENFEVGKGEANVKVGLESGLYTIVAAPADKAGALRTKEALVQSFYFVGMGETVDMTCQFEGVLVLPSEFNPAYTASFPDQTSLFAALIGKDLKSVSYYLNKTSVVATWTDTPEALVAAYGSAVSAANIETINSENGGVLPFQKLADNTEYTAIFVATNIYGESKTLVLTKKTAAYEYTGELAIGDYAMYCKFVYGEGADEFMESMNVFNVASNSNSATDYLVTNIGIENGAVWHAKYDSAAGTLTLDGTELGYEEDYGNQFGGLYGYYDSAKSMAYGLFSYASAESYGNDPLVLTVDPTTKQLSGLATAEFAVQVHQMADGYPFLGYHSYFVSELTTIAPYTATASKQSVKSQAVVPFRNAKGVRNLSAPKSKIGASIEAGALLSTPSKSLKSVKPSVVENYTPAKVRGVALKANPAVIAR